MTKKQIENLLWLGSKGDAITKNDFINAVGPEGAFIENDKEMSIFLGAYRAVMNSSGETPDDVPVKLSPEFIAQIKQLIHNINEAVTMDQLKESLKNELQNLINTIQKMIDNKKDNQPGDN